MSRRQNKRRVSKCLLGAAAPVAIGLFSASPAAASTCSQLATSFHRPNTTITTAQTVPAGTFVSSDGETLTGLPQFCQVAGFTTPTSDSHINFEVWIPETSWNSKYLQMGCGGFCGSIALQYGTMAVALRRGYATAATDDGHQAGAYDAAWAVGHPQKVVDFGYRALKETTDVAKDIVMAFKSSGARRSYFVGCSDGGREALMEAQRYPLDFDGILVGSPANYWTHHFTGFVWDQKAVAATTSGNLSQADLNVLSNAMLGQCVGRDGGLSTDHFLNNPLACRFNPEKLSLSQDKIEAVKKIFSGPPGIFPGYRVTGDEASDPGNWPTWLTSQGVFGDSYFSYMVFPNSGWTPDTYSIAENAHQADVRTGAILNAIDPNLRPFKQHGGKLIQYVGWGDTAISPENALNYHRAVTQEMGGHEDTQDFYRLFMVPGMGHCLGGPGANAFGQPFGLDGPNPSDASDDILTALDQWVEQQNAPDKIVATKYVNDDPTQGIAFQRPLCPFPQYAKFKGTGSTTSAASFACVKPDHDDHDKEASNR